MQKDIKEKASEGWIDEHDQKKDEADLMNYLNARIGQYESKMKQTQSYLKAQEQEY